MEKTEKRKDMNPIYVKLSTGQYIVFRPCENSKKRIAPYDLSHLILVALNIFQKNKFNKFIICY